MNNFLINQEYCYINDLFKCWPLGSVNPDMLTQLMLVLLMASSSFQRIDISYFEKKLFGIVTKFLDYLETWIVAWRSRGFARRSQGVRGGFGVFQNRPSLLDPLDALESIRLQWNHVGTSMDQDGARPTTDQDTKIYQNF